MRHMKRQKVPKNWPIPRKGNAFVVRPNHSNEKGLPILIILRDVLNIAKTRKEVKKAIHEKNLLINGKSIKNEKNTAVLFDVITIVPSKKNYRIELTQNGKFKIEEIKSTEANSKIAKIVNKKTLKNKKMQLNLSDGNNILYDKKCNTGESVVINLKDKKIEKILPLKTKSKVLVYAGKHTGKKGTIEDIDEKNKKAVIIEENSKEKQKINVLIKQIMVVE
jgi:small subunit ribosomal protein S4e